MGRTVSTLSESGARVVFFRFLWLWDVGFWVFAGFAMTRRVTQWMLDALRLARAPAADLAHRKPDIIVSVYPHATEVLGRLRRNGRLHVPVCAVITDLAGAAVLGDPGRRPPPRHPSRVDRGGALDRRRGRPRALRPRLHRAGVPRAARGRTRRGRRSKLDPGAKIVLVSGGGWGVGDVEGAVREVLEVKGVDQVVCLCGRNEELRDAARARLRRRHARARRGVHRRDARLARRGRRARPLDRRAHRARGADARLPGDLLRLGPRPRPAHNHAFTRFGLAQVAATPGALRDARRDRARAGAHRESTSRIYRPPPRSSSPRSNASARAVHAA